MTDAQSLTIALGGRWAGSTGMACCPAHDDRSPSLSIANGDNGRLLLRCHAGCDFRDILDALKAKGHLGGAGSFRPIGALCRRELGAVKRTHDDTERRIRQAAGTWQESRPISGTLAERYLRGRSITCALPDTLRYKDACWHQSARRFPAMVSRIGNAPGNPRAIHRTYLRADGLAKADVTPSKAMLGPASGYAVRLSQEAGPLVVTEGIETGLSLLSGLFPCPASVWAALSAPGMRALCLPPIPGDLVIAPDGDPVGHAAAAALATRADAQGWRVSLFRPPEGFDWNDVLTGRAARA